MMYLWDNLFNHSIDSDCFFQAFKFIVNCINRKESFFESKGILSLQSSELLLRGTDELILE